MTTVNKNIAAAFISWPFGVLICAFVIIIAAIVCIGAVLAAVMWPLLVGMGQVSTSAKKV